MITSEVTLHVLPPRKDSPGYMLHVSGNAPPGRRLGYICVGDDERTVYASFNRLPWEPVGTVTSITELTPAWITEHADAILRPF